MKRHYLSRLSQSSDAKPLLDGLFLHFSALGVTSRQDPAPDSKTGGRAFESLPPCC